LEVDGKDNVALILINKKFSNKIFIYLFIVIGSCEHFSLGFVERGEFLD
jgi:hypothetical protein